MANYVKVLLIITTRFKWQIIIKQAYKFIFNSTAVLNLSGKNTHQKNVQMLQFCRSTYYIHLLVVEAICFLLSTCTNFTALLQWDTINASGATDHG